MGWEVEARTENHRSAKDGSGTVWLMDDITSSRNVRCLVIDHQVPDASMGRI